MLYIFVVLIFSTKLSNKPKAQTKHNELKNFSFNSFTHREVIFMDGDLQDAIQDAQYFGALCDPVPRYIYILRYNLGLLLN